MVDDHSYGGGGGLDEDFYMDEGQRMSVALEKEIRNEQYEDQAEMSLF